MLFVLPLLSYCLLFFCCVSLFVCLCQRSSFATTLMNPTSILALVGIGQCQAITCIPVPNSLPPHIHFTQYPRSPPYILSKSRFSHSLTFLMIWMMCMNLSFSMALSMSVCDLESLSENGYGARTSNGWTRYTWMCRCMHFL